MNRLFREQAIPGIQVDDDHTPAKHDSVALREERHKGWLAGDRRRFITARRLADWLRSDWRHKRRHMGLGELPFEPVRCGLYYSLRLGGVWVAADWWLHYFAVDHTVTALRLEHLAEDLNSHLLPLLPPGTAPFQQLPRANAAAAHQAPPPQAFSAGDLARIHAVNPRWSTWEHRVYGP